MCGGVHLLPPVPRTPRTPLRALGPGAFAILAAVTEALTPEADGLPSGWALQVPENVDRQLDRLHPGDVDEFAQALWILESPAAGLLLDQRVGRFTSASLAERQRVLEAWRTSALPDRRKAYRALSGLVNAAYWAHPQTYPHVGYPGPPRFPT